MNQSLFVIVPKNKCSHAARMRHLLLKTILNRPYEGRPSVEHHCWCCASWCRAGQMLIAMQVKRLQSQLRDVQAGAHAVVQPVGAVFKATAGPCKDKAPMQAVSKHWGDACKAGQQNCIFALNLTTHSLLLSCTKHRTFTCFIKLLGHQQCLPAGLETQSVCSSTRLHVLCCAHAPCLPSHRQEVGHQGTRSHRQHV